MDKVANGNIFFILDQTMDEVVGDAMGCKRPEMKSTKDGSITGLAVAGVFVAIGHSPNTGIF